ncbi:NUP153 family protein [Megaselia abdita]
MSADEDNNNSIEDGNTSIIGKVKSRVSSIFPQKFSKWFTPTADAKNPNQNGNLRRRRTESEDQEEPGSEDDEEQNITTPYKAPPAKRSRLNANETMFNFKGNDNLMSSSTPYIPAGKIRNTIIAAHSNPDSPEVVDIFSEPQEVRNRRALNITHVSTRNNYASIPDEFVIPSTSRGFRGLQQDIIEVPDENEEDEVDDGVQVNGRYTPASESGGESRGSSVQPKLSRNFEENERGLGGEFNLDSHLEGRKSLFANSKNKFNINNSTLSLTSFNRRRFNSSIYGSTSALSDSRLLHTFSPFYRGPTTFGGANAYSRYSTNNSTRNVRLTPTLIRPTSSLSSSLAASNLSLNQSGTSAPISSTAQRILELIQDFPTPLSDAKKLSSTLKLSMNSTSNISQSQSQVPPLANTRSKRFSDLMDIPSARPIHLSRVRTPYTRNEAVSQQLPSNKELQVPSMVQLLKMKKLLSTTEKAREIAGKSKSLLNVEEEYKLPNQEEKQSTQPQKRSGKIQNKITNVRAGSKKQFDADNEESVAPVNLPNIPLPFMKEVPKIDIDIAPKVVQTTVYKATEKIVTPKVTTTDSAMTFNECKEISTLKSGNVAPVFSADKAPTLTSSLSVFQFSEPIKVGNGVSSCLPTSPLNNFKFSPPAPADLTSLKLPDAPTTAIAPETKSSSPPKLKTGSVFEALMKPIIPATTPLSEVMKPTSNKWECNVCMIKNDDARDKCEACSTPKSKPLTSLSSFASTASKKWECQVCMIRNDEARSTCEACSTPKAKPAPVSTPLKTTDSGFKSILAKQSAKWECSDCMTRNEQDSNKCLCCQKAKPGAQPTSSSALSAPLKTTDSGFQSILAKQSEKWECPACLTRNESNRSKCGCCDQAKPGAVAEDVPKFSFGSNSASKFTFGFAGATKESDIRKDEDKPPAASLPSVTSPPSSNFSFGFGAKTPAKDEVDKKDTTFSFGVKSTSTVASAPATVTTAATPTFSFGVPTPAAATKTTSAPSTVLTLGSSTTSSPVTTAPSFGSPAPSPAPTPAPIFGSIKPVVTPTPAAPKEEVKGGFSFGVPAAASSQPTPAFGAPAKAETAPSTFVFGKPAVPTISATTNFGGTTSTPPTLPTTTPTSLFSFGAPSKTETPSFGSPSAVKPVIPSFGSAVVKPEAPAFGSAMTKPEVPTFGSSLIVKPEGLSFGAGSTPKTDVPSFGSTAAKPDVPAFGSALKTAESKPFVFGSEASSGPSANLSFGSSSIQPATPSFGGSTFGSSTNSTPAFGANSAPAGSGMFGSSATTAPAFGSSNSLNNNSGFGGSNNTFGGFGASASPAQSRSDGGPMAKKPFNFGGSAASNTPSPVTFGGQTNNNNTQKAFNFSAPSAQQSTGAFNFTGSTVTEAASGAAFQFNANNNAGQPNPFAPQPTPQNKRKIISATRRKPR